MYTPHSFKEENPEKIFDLIEQHNFGVLFSQHKDKPEATHLPFLVNRGKNLLTAHFARANKHWKHIHENKNLLVVFQGPHTYISPDWYEEKNTVPTWNYAAVHVTGKPKLFHSPDQLRKMVDQLTHHHEEIVKSNWDYEAAHQKREKLLRGIVGIEISIGTIEATYKFNQNKSKEDQKSVINALSESGFEHDREVGNIMKENLARGENPS